MWALELNIRPASKSSQTIRVCGGELEQASYVQVAELWDIIDKQPKRPLCQSVSQALIDDLSRIKISPVTPDNYGLDGVIYKLSYSAGFNNVEYCWWCDLPDAWSELQPIIDRLLDIAKSS